MQHFRTLGALLLGVICCILAARGEAERLAWLGMYDFHPDLQEANDIVWSALKDCLVAHRVQNVPAKLARESVMNHVWEDTRMLLAQTCGYPYMKSLRSKGIQLVATPVYGAPVCEVEGHLYRSLVIVKKNSSHSEIDDLRERIAVINSLDSNSGMNVFREMVSQRMIADQGSNFFAQVKVSDGHVKSVEMIANGTADVASIDCVSFSLLMDLRPDLTDQVRVLAKTEESPGLPLITSERTSINDLNALRRCLTEVFSSEEEHVESVQEWEMMGLSDMTGDEHIRLKRAKRTLRLRGIRVWTRQEEAEMHYQRILDLEKEAEGLNYPLLL